MGFKLKINHLIKLVSEASNGQDKFKEGTIGFNGYGFVFREFDYNSKDSFVIGDGSSKLCSIGAFRDLYERSLERLDSLEDLAEIVEYDRDSDLYFGGAIKTLVPDVEFGGYEDLYCVWMFVKTPQGKMFPTTFYHGKSGASVGAWSPDYRAFLFAEERTLPQDFESIVNFSPFNFTKIELEEFIEALKLALNKVPISDFEGVYEDDFGKELMRIKSSEPFVEPLEVEHEKINTWSYSIMGNDEAWDFSSDFVHIMLDYLTPEEDDKYPREIPKQLFKSLIERAYDRLIAYACEKKSRLAFMILGRSLMLHKCKITEELRQTILKYSDWDYEKDQLKDERDRKERKEFLNDFREKIKAYDGSKVVKVPFYTVTRVINEKREKGDTTPVNRQNIDYSIENSGSTLN